MTQHIWQYSVDDCDVQDKERLRGFRTLADEWIDCLNGDPINSVYRQIHEMMWEDAAWRSLNHARFLSRDRGDATTPSLVAALLDSGYVKCQIVAITKLIEPRATNSKKQVNSLERVITEVSDNRELLTREVFVCRDGLPYDCSPPSLPPGPPKVIWESYSGPSAWPHSVHLHKVFDELSGVKPANRQRSDTISEDYFELIKAELKAPVFTGIRALRNKSIAHAATAYSRASDSNMIDGASLNLLAEAHQKIISLYEKVAAQLLYLHAIGNVIAIPQYNIFEGMSLPIVHADDLPKMHEFWRMHCEERDAWLH